MHPLLVSYFFGMQKLASKSIIRPALAGVLFDPQNNKLVVTDTFRLLEVSKTIEGITEPVVLRVPGFTGRSQVAVNDMGDIVIDGKKNLVVEQKTPGDEFPKYEQVLPKTEDAKFTFKVNAELLAGLLAEQAKHQKNPHVTLHFYEDNKGLFITGEDTRAIIMPVLR